jgi:hypothetical protein
VSCDTIQRIRSDRISPNPNQAGIDFEKAGLVELAESIKAKKRHELKYSYAFTGSQFPVQGYFRRCALYEQPGQVKADPTGFKDFRICFFKPELVANETSFIRP